jgi:PAS domain S-box-containing protein
MSRKPTYEELEQRVRELEKENTNLKKSELLLRESEERYRTIIQDSIDGVVIVDGMEIKLVNKAILGMFGYQSEEEVLGLKFTEMVSPEYHKLMMERGRARDSGQDVVNRYEFKAIRKDGTEFHCELSVSNIRDQGKVLRQGIVRDITERKLAERALRESEEKYRVIYTGSSDGIIVADPETKKFLYVNPAICKILGYSEKELTQKGVADIHPKGSLEHVTSEFEAQARGKKLLASDIPFLKKNGEIIYMDTNASVVKMNGKRRLMGIFRDTTDRKKAEAALRKAHEELEQRVKERTNELNIKNKSLEDLNTAMKVLLEKRAEDKIKLEDNLLANVRELITPMFDKINKTELDDHQKMMLNIIESNLNEITSPFVQKLSMKHLNLTPTELKIANYIKHGTTTKKIAELMKSSPRTIDTHRKNIRKKIGLDKKSKNLRSFLLSIN